MTRRTLVVAVITAVALSGCTGGQSEEDARSACRRTAQEANQIVRDILRAMVVVQRGQRTNIGAVETRLDRLNSRSDACKAFRENADPEMRACARLVGDARGAAQKFFGALELIPPQNTRLIQAAFFNTVPPALPSIRRASRSCSGQAPSPTP